MNWQFIRQYFQDGSKRVVAQAVKYFVRKNMVNLCPTFFNIFNTSFRPHQFFQKIDFYIGKVIKQLWLAAI